MQIENSNTITGFRLQNIELYNWGTFNKKIQNERWCTI